MRSTVFLDTTISADRHFQTTNRQTEIRQQLEDKRVVCSDYVIGELKSSFLRNSITLYNLLLDEESVEDALKRLSSVVHSVRQYDRTIKLFAYLAERVGFRRDDLVERLDMLIDEMDILFREDIHDFVNTCDCARSRATAKKEGRRWIFDLGCRQNPKPRCAIASFWNDNHQSLSSISALPALVGTKMATKMGQMARDEIKNYGTNCWYAGDAIIALEVPVDSSIYTTNKVDFGPICSYLQKPIYEESWSRCNRQVLGVGSQSRQIPTIVRRQARGLCLLFSSCRKTDVEVSSIQRNPRHHGPLVGQPASAAWSNTQDFLNKEISNSIRTLGRESAEIPAGRSGQ